MTDRLPDFARYTGVTARPAVAPTIRVEPDWERYTGVKAAAQLALADRAEQIAKTDLQERVARREEAIAQCAGALTRKSGDVDSVWGEGPRDPVEDIMRTVAMVRRGA